MKGKTPDKFGWDVGKSITKTDNVIFDCLYLYVLVLCCECLCSILAYDKDNHNNLSAIEHKHNCIYMLWFSAIRHENSNTTNIAKKTAYN